MKAVERRDALVGISNLSFAYPPFFAAAGAQTGGAEPAKALDGVSLTVMRGEYIAVLGANGSGKSTLAACLTGLCRPPEGAVAFRTADGRALDPSREADLPAIRRMIAAVPQNPEDNIVGFTVLEDAAFGPLNAGLAPPAAHERARAALELTGLWHLRDRPCVSLSGGERQRLGFAAALAMVGTVGADTQSASWSASVLLLDEPFSMLDSAYRAEASALLKRLSADGLPVLHITHSTEEARQADRAILLEAGRLVFDGPPSLLPERPRPAPRCSVRPASGTRENAEGAVVFSGVSFAYNKKNRKDADTADTTLTDITCAIAKGGITAITGASGSGKTTMLKLINALLLPTDGSVRVLGRDTRDAGTPLRFFRATSALAVQNCEAAIFEYYTADDAAYGPKAAGLRGEPLVERVRSAMGRAALPFAEFADRPTFALSGGEKRRCAIAGVLALNSEVVLLDEAEAGLDADGRARLFDTLDALALEGKTVVMATHSEETAAFADRRIALSGGSIIAETSLMADGMTEAASCAKEGTEGTEGTASRPAKLRKKTGIEFFRAFSAAGLGRGARFGAFLRTYPRVLVMMLIIAALQAAFTLPGDTSRVLLRLGAVALTARELARAGALVLRLSLIVASAAAVFSLVPPARAIAFVNGVLLRVEALGLGTLHARLALSIMFRFVPILAEEAELIVCAQMSRGGGRRRDRLTMIIPLLLRALSRARKVAEAMTMRGFQ